MSGTMFFRAPAFKKSAGKVNDGIAVPAHRQPFFYSNAGDFRRLQVFCSSKTHKSGAVFRRDNAGHALLRFTYGKLRSVKSFVFFGDFVKVDSKAGGQFPNGHSRAACAKIITALDHRRRLFIAKEALQLPFLRRVALLHFRAALFQRQRRVGLGRAGSPAAAVPARAPAKQDNNIAGTGSFPLHMSHRSGADDRAQFKMLRHITCVVELPHKSCGNTDLVAVGTVTCGGGFGDFPLREFTGEGFFHMGERIGRAADTHRLIHITSACKRIADCPPYAGSRPAEGFYLGGMVVRLVLKHQQPGFLFAVDNRFDFDRTGVDLLRFVKAGQEAAGFEILCADNGHVHQGNR